MKTRILMAEALSMNHNEGGLNAKPQISQAMTVNHNPGGLKLKPQMTQAMTHNHNLPCAPPCLRASVVQKPITHHP